MNASLTYGPQLQRLTCHWQFYRHKLFTVCTEQVRSRTPSVYSLARCLFKRMHMLFTTDFA